MMEGVSEWGAADTENTEDEGCVVRDVSGGERIRERFGGEGRDGFGEGGRWFVFWFWYIFTVCCRDEERAPK
jgi:hypothetical protein